MFTAPQMMKYVLSHILILLSVSLNTNAQPDKAQILVSPFVKSKEQAIYNIQPILDALKAVNVELTVEMGEDYVDTLFKSRAGQYDLVIVPPHIAAILLDKHDYQALFYGKNKVKFSIYTHKKNKHINDLFYMRGGVLVGNDRYAISTAIAATTLKRELDYTFNGHYFYQSVGGYDEVVKTLLSNEQQYGVLMDNMKVTSQLNNNSSLKKIYSLGSSHNSIILLNKKSLIYEEINDRVNDFCLTQGFEKLAKKMQVLNGFEMICAKHNPIKSDFIEKYRLMFRSIR